LEPRVELIFIPVSFTSQNAADFVPQKPPFVLVDQLIYVDEKTSSCNFTVPAEHIFVNRGFYSTSGMVESMAQTAAAGTGFLSRKDNKKVPIGYIGAVQKLEVIDWPPANAEIRMDIKLLTNILQVSLVSGTVIYQGKTMASCEMKIFINSQS
jgi:predicted hotdog family 3-hydroxylacyl-ACP dehydratase